MAGPRVVIAGILTACAAEWKSAAEAAGVGEIDAPGNREVPPSAVQNARRKIARSVTAVTRLVVDPSRE
jgi:hypothetical protein